MGSLCWIPLTCKFNCFYFVTVVSTLFETASSIFFEINLSAIERFVLDQSLIALIPRVKA